MNQEDLRKRKERAETETLIISLTDDGFRVYNPETPANSYIVSGSTENPKCTCPDFQLHAADHEWHCKHILAVLNQLAKAAAKASKQDPGESQEKKPVQQEDHPPEKKERKRKPNGTSQMVIKRSVSPDGRIDSLSVEFSYPVEQTSPEEIKERAQRTLEIQSEIVGSFLKGTAKKSEAPKGNGTPEDKGDNGAGDGSAPAQMLNVAGMTTRKGWKLFINVQVNGQTSKLFGSRKELGEYVADAGFANLADRIDQGVMLNIPCRVIAEPSPDGRYLNIQRVFPATSLQTNEGRQAR